MEHLTKPQLNVQLLRADPDDALDALFLEPFITGELPRARMLVLQRVRLRAPLVPAGVRPLRVSVDPNLRVTLARGEGWLLRSQRWSNGRAELSVVARSAALADRILAEAAKGASEPVPIDLHQARVGFWHAGREGPSRSERSVAVQPWSEIRDGYTARAAAALDRLVALEPGSRRGRLLLLHGPPGTGKTTILRALASAWRSWCLVDYVLDPDHLFASPGYLLQVALGEEEEEEDDEAHRKRWRLLVLEDCDELIGAGAKRESGQALARLLNLTDGLLGQGLRLLVAITTNESLARLHPAVIRPGRCLAQIEVGRLTAAEARRWLGRPADVASEGASLAELCSIRDGDGPIEHTAEAASVGQYL